MNAFHLDKTFLGFYRILLVTLEIRKSITNILVSFDIQYTFFFRFAEKIEVYISVTIVSKEYENINIVNQTENDLLKLVYYFHLGDHAGSFLSLYSEYSF